MSAAIAAFHSMKPLVPTALPDFAAGHSSGEEVLSDEELSLREDALLLGRAQSGDATAFDTIVLKFSPRLYALVYHMTSNHDDTNDLLQDVWAKAYRNISGFRGNSRLYTWLHSIAANTTINFIKKRSRRWTMSLDDVDNGIANDKDFAALAATSDPVREMDLGELQRRINEAMMKLSPDHRAVVTMFDIQGMCHADIGEILGLSEGTVRSRLFYAHKQLQAWLSEFAPASKS
jgi:RNA polymerase sigma factor (sigma-70 family)